MKKLILTLVLAVCSFQVGFSQGIDQATLTKIKVKLINAEKLYEQGEYYDVLDKRNHIESQHTQNPEAMQQKTILLKKGWFG